MGSLKSRWISVSRALATLPWLVWRRRRSRRATACWTTSEFGRDAPLHAAGSVLLFGGGIKKGVVYGKTADERPCTTIENPVPVENLHATTYHALGIPPDHSFLIEKRPVYVTKDATGKVIYDLFA